MHILDSTIHFDKETGLTINLDWKIIIFIVCSIILLAIVLRLIIPNIDFRIKKIEIEQVSIGTANNRCVLKYNNKDKEIAFKLWVEISTRKIGLKFEEGKDVVVEVYDSWYKFFGIARNLFKEMPVSKLRNIPDLINITEKILNDEMRPHLTEYQAKFRRWYNDQIELEENTNLSPQQIQSKCSYYNELVADLNKRIDQIVIYKNTLEKIAFGQKGNKK